MKGTLSTLIRRPLIVATLTLSLLVTSVSTVGATSYSTTTIPSAQQPVCGVVVNRSVHIVSKSPCVIRVRRGTNVQIRLRSGFRWGYPVSTSRAVVVNIISRDSFGVTAFTFHAAYTGRATIRATGTVACRPGVACPDLALLWLLDVIVT